MHSLRAVNVRKHHLYTLYYHLQLPLWKWGLAWEKLMFLFVACTFFNIEVIWRSHKNRSIPKNRKTIVTICHAQLSNVDWFFSVNETFVTIELQVRHMVNRWHSHLRGKIDCWVGCPDIQLFGNNFVPIQCALNHFTVSLITNKASADQFFPIK